MSNSEAISVITDTLRAKLNAAAGLSGAVTTEPLDKLTVNDANPSLNLHLYQILPNAHWRNMDIPWKAKPGERGNAPLALDLRYLLTATAPKQTVAQKDLGIGMRVLHDNPVIDPVGAAIAPFERARISMQPLSLDDMEKLWAGISTPRLLSVAYEVSVVLIESELPISSPLPVLSRGTGPDSIAVETGLYPTIDWIEIGDREFDRWLRSRSRPGRSAAQVDDTIFVYGHGMATGDTVVIRSLMHGKRPNGQDTVLTPTIAGANGRGGWTVDLTKLNFVTAEFPAGPCAITLEIKNGNGQIDVTNAMPFSLAPKITALAAGTKFAVPQDVTINFDPPLVERQTAVLIVGSRQFPATTIPDAGDTSLTFRLERIEPGDYPVRLRVDGVDSAIVDLDKEIPDSGRPAFSNVATVTA